MKDSQKIGRATEEERWAAAAEQGHAAPADFEAGTDDFPSVVIVSGIFVISGSFMAFMYHLHQRQLLLKRQGHKEQLRWWCMCASFSVMFLGVFGYAYRVNMAVYEEYRERTEVRREFRQVAQHVFACFCCLLGTFYYLHQDSSTGISPFSTLK